jgi:hypothetical protein
MTNNNKALINKTNVAKSAFLPILCLSIIYKLENTNPVNNLNKNAYRTITNMANVNHAKALK